MVVDIIGEISGVIGPWRATESMCVWEVYCEPSACGEKAALLADQQLVNGQSPVFELQWPALLIGPRRSIHGNYLVMTINIILFICGACAFVGG